MFYWAKNYLKLTTSYKLTEYLWTREHTIKENRGSLEHRLDSKLARKHTTISQLFC